MYFKRFAFKKVSFLFLEDSLRWRKAFLMIKHHSVNAMLKKSCMFLNNTLYGNVLHTLLGCQGHQEVSLLCSRGQDFD